MRVGVDDDRCVGHGRCYVLAPEIFAPDEFGHCVVLQAEVTGEAAEAARVGAANCPEGAITVED